MAVPIPPPARVSSRTGGPLRGLKIRISSKGDSWDRTAHTWFHDRRGEVFDVIEIHEGLQRIYEVDVSRLAQSGEIDLRQAFVPAVYAEEIVEQVTLQ
jgi:hypothetical protein